MPDARTSEASAPQAAGLPALSHEAGHRIYRDATEASRLCVDSLEPHLRSRGLQTAGPGPRSGRAARPVAISFGPGEGALRRVHALYNEHHASALVWLSGPFFAWARRAGGVHLIDHGDTARGRVHEAHVHGRQPEGVELTQAVAAAELVHWGRLHGATVRAAARPGVVEAVRQGARLGRRAAWTSTLGDALAAVLTDLLRRESLQITVASGPLPLRAFEEVRELVLMEWAHRLAGGQPLSLPAAQIGGLLADPDLDLGLVWRDGDRVPLRVVRSLRYESLATDSARALGWGLVGSRQAGAAPA